MANIDDNILNEVFGFDRDIQKNSIESNGLKEIFWSNNIYNRQDIEWYTKFNRFGVLDPYNGIGVTKEYIFFTKPDLNICIPGTTKDTIGVDTLNPDLQSIPFFIELVQRYPEVVCSLQRSIATNDNSPFMNVLSNSVKNTISVNSISADEIDTPQTIYGTSISYRGDGFSSDEKADFSLEFEDTRYLEIYHLLKAYELYERLKRIGMVKPPKGKMYNDRGEEVVYPTSKNGYYYGLYTKERRLHDQFGIYKFILDEDFESVVYYSYFCGVMINSVPRDAFSNLTNEGLRYSVDFKSAFVDDMSPEILADFNYLIETSYGYDPDPNKNNETHKSVNLPVYSDTIKNVDGTWASFPYIKRIDKDSKTWLGPQNMKYSYKLTWRLSQ